MKQVIQSLRNGHVEVVDVPVPQCGKRQLLVATRATLISAGTERMMLEFGRSNWLAKARQQPDKVRMVLDKARTDGVIATLESVRTKLDQPLAPGYCNVGVVREVGQSVTGYVPGDRVVSNGKHAEFVSVPINLCARVPDEVSDEDAAFTVVGAIALQGVRLAAPTFGETVAVMGLGLIGLITVQLLKANGCRVIGFDYDPAKVSLARRFGAHGIVLSPGVDAVTEAEVYSAGRGVDAVLITAATDSNEPVTNAARMSRKRGRIVLVGVAGLQLSRADFFEKELTFQVSCSYGPGRYDSNYEEGGNDYPLGFVRWTEQRNFEAVLEALADGQLDFAALRSHEFAIEDAGAAYDLIGSHAPSLGVILQFERDDAPSSTDRTVALSADGDRKCDAAAPGSGRVNFIGAGGYAGAALIPAFVAAEASLNAIVSANGLNAVQLGRKFGFVHASSDLDAAIADPHADCLVIATRHDTHADLVIRGIQAGKRVFVEKPLALTLDDLDRVEQACRQASDPEACLMVGFNRRFSPFAQRMKSLISNSSTPLSMTMTVNAGTIPADHWTQDIAIGGGRIVGEACHFLDLMRFLAAAPIIRSDVMAMDGPTRDSAVLTLQFADGSIGSIQYFANGSKDLPKERLEVFSAGRILQLDNFRKLTAHGWGKKSGMRAIRQDKGQVNCARSFIEAARAGKASPIPLNELLEVSRVSIELAERTR